MHSISVEHHPSQARLEELGILKCPTWSKEPSTFPWTYSSQETAYILEGEVTVTTSQGDSVDFSAGDLVIFPSGLSCTWHVKKTLRKHYLFD
jgi:uncharacterized protein